MGQTLDEADASVLVVEEKITTVSLRLSAEDLAWLDHLRGRLSRADYLRGLLLTGLIPETWTLEPPRVQDHGDATTVRVDYASNRGVGGPNRGLAILARRTTFGAGGGYWTWRAFPPWPAYALERMDSEKEYDNLTDCLIDAATKLTERGVTVVPDEWVQT